MLLLLASMPNPDALRMSMFITYQLHIGTMLKLGCLQLSFKNGFKQVMSKHEGKCVLLLLDNCPSHKLGNMNLSCIDIHFLPPNTTSKIQPMDTGIIAAFKRHYRHYQIK